MQYKKDEHYWFKLDNAGKIFPAQNNSKWSNVFRFAVFLKEKINPELLETALKNIMPRFICFDVRIKRGLFWYFFEKNLQDCPPVLPDIKNPCYRIKYSENRNFLFRVFYYENKVAVEFFHALTDGYGSVQFLSTLLAEYLRLKGNEIPPGGNVLDITQAPKESELEDSFLRYANSKVKAKRAGKFVYHRKGEKLPNHNINITTGYMNVNEVLEQARKYKVTLTEYIAGVLGYIHYKRQMLENITQKEIAVQVPVNLRRSFPSDTLRNFSLAFATKFDPKMGEYTFEEILRQYSLYLRYINNEKQLNSMMSGNLKLERNPFMRLMPLFIKRLSIAAVFYATTEKTVTAAISNIGKLDLPAEMDKHIDRVMFMMGPGYLNGARFGAISYGDSLAITCANIYNNTDIERDFFTFLVKNGIHVKIESNRD